MDIDEQLLSKNEEAKAGEFRASKRAQESENIAQEGTSFREQVKSSRESKEAKAEDSPISPSISPILKATDEALKFAWENLITSWGLTLLYIDLHVFLNKVFGPKVFRDPGEEWVPDSVKKVVSKIKSAASLLKIVEGSGIGCLNLGCLFILLFVVSFLAIVASILDPIDNLKLIWDLFTGFLSDLAKIFE